MDITLKAARVNKELTQKEAAKKIGVSVETLAKWESGATFPSVVRIPAIEHVYGFKYGELNFLPNNYRSTVICQKENIE